MIEERFVITDRQWSKIEPHCLGKKTDPTQAGSNGTGSPDPSRSRTHNIALSIASPQSRSHNCPAGRQSGRAGQAAPRPSPRVKTPSPGTPSPGEVPGGVAQEPQGDKVLIKIHSMKILAPHPKSQSDDGCGLA